MMKKFLALILVVFFASGAWGAYYDEGNDGSSWDTAYLIKSVDDLKLMRDRINNSNEDDGKFYKLTADIDLSSQTNWRGIGYSNGFTGCFDGQNHTIKLNINDEDIYAGLFYEISTEDGEIAVRNLNISGNIRSDWAGGLTWKMNSGIIENCSFTGVISVYGNWAGGFVDLMYGGTIRNCRVNAKISSVHSSAGFVAELYDGLIENCTTETGSEITSLQYSGGIIGLMHGGHVNNCSTSVVLNRAQLKGGIVGGATTSVSQNLSGNNWPNIYPQIGLVADDLPDNPTSDDVNNNPVLSWNGHKYQVYNENLTWEQAKAKCEALGGHLATITSKAEQDFIEQVIANSDVNYSACWLGAKADDYGIRSWVTNEVFERQYSNFAANQPDGSGNYLQIFVQNSSSSNFSYSIGDWDDTNLYGINSEEISQHGFICEWEEEPDEVKLSPIARDFVNWLENPEDWKNSGTLPDPEDTSHLINNPPKNNSVRVTENEILPVSYDARTTTGLPPARNQLGFNTCWAFASLGAMEADYLAQNMTSLGTSPDLSELHLAWNIYNGQREIYADDCVLDQGGDTGKTIAFLKQNDISPVNEKNMSYDIAGTSKDISDEKIKEFLSTSPDIPKAPLNLKDGLIIEGDNIVSYDRNSNYNDENIITDSMTEESRNRVKTLIMEHGAVFFCYYIDNNGYNSENNAFYSISGNEYHAALIVGWDDNFSRENFNESSRPDENGAWLIRNSRRGEYDGVNGYFWMSYQQIMQRLRLFTVIEEKIDIPQPENKTEIKTTNISYPWSAKIFKAERNENLTAVDFYTTDNNAQYKVYAKNLGKIKPQNPGGTEYISLEGELSYTGMHGYMELSEPIELYSGDYYSVIIRMILSSDYEYPTGASGHINGYYRPEVEAGVNFFAENKEGEDVPSYWYDGLSMDKGPFASTINALTVARPKIDNGTKPSLTTSSLPEANVGDEYNFTLSASGTGNIEYFCGNVPLGLKLSKQGVLSGVPKDGGEHTLHLTLRNKIDDVKANLAMKINGDPYLPEEDEENNNGTDNNQDNRNNNSVGSSGGGCNTGACLLSFVLVLAALTKRK